VLVRTKRLRNKKTGKVYEYNQLVKAVWNGGKPRQRVLAHLGEYGSIVERAAFRAELNEIAPVHQALLEEEKKHERRIRERFGAPLERYHDGEIPSTKEVEGR
jgi:hypothetical protein